MYKNLVTVTVAVLIIIGGLTACSPIEKITKRNGSPTAITFKPDGEPVVIATSSGKPLPTCKERDNPKTSKGFEPCRVRLVIEKDKSGEVVNVKIFDRKTGEELPKDKIKEVRTTTTAIFEGSHCEISDIAGAQYLDCWPWPHF